MVDHTETEPGGTVISFYSYKGGVGRSMAAANLACLCAQRVAPAGQKVLLIDWDLEAPGLHRFFPVPDMTANDMRPGLIDYFERLSQRLAADTDIEKRLESSADPRLLNEIVPIENFIVTDVARGVDLIKAGRFDSDYARRVSSFDWSDFYERYADILHSFRRLLATSYPYCLIDSRTGIADVAGISTAVLSEKLVAVFAPNHQSLYGVADIVRRAVEYRRASNDLRPLAVFPLPSRIDLAEQNLRQQWRRAYQTEFELLFKKLYGLPECDLRSYFDEVQLPYISYYSYGEELAVQTESNEALSLRRAYEIFFQRLVDQECAWAYPATKPPGGVGVIDPTLNTVANSYDYAVNALQREQLGSIKLRLDSLSREIRGYWAEIGQSMAGNPDPGATAVRGLVAASGGFGGVSLAIARLDSEIAYPDWKAVIENLLNYSRRDQGYETLLSVPGAAGGFFYMTTCVAALHWKSWGLLSQLLNDKFEWYYQSGRALYNFGFQMAYFFHPEALQRDGPKAHDLFRALLNESSYGSLMNLDSEAVLNLYLQTQLVHCLRSAQEAERGGDGSIWADYGRFHAFRVMPLLDRAFNDLHYGTGLATAFSESLGVWKQNLNPRLRYIREHCFQGAPYFWSSIEGNYSPHGSTRS